VDRRDRRKTQPIADLLMAAGLILLVGGLIGGANAGGVGAARWHALELGVVFVVGSVLCRRV
jgi:hypothetical protein